MIDYTVVAIGLFVLLCVVCWLAWQFYKEAIEHQKRMIAISQAAICEAPDLHGLVVREQDKRRERSPESQMDGYTTLDGPCIKKKTKVAVVVSSRRFALFELDRGNSENENFRFIRIGGMTCAMRFDVIVIVDSPTTESEVETAANWRWCREDLACTLKPGGIIHHSYLGE